MLLCTFLVVVRTKDIIYELQSGLAHSWPAAATELLYFRRREEEMRSIKKVDYRCIIYMRGVVVASGLFSRGRGNLARAMLCYFGIGLLALWKMQLEFSGWVRWFFLICSRALCVFIYAKSLVSYLRLDVLFTLRCRWIRKELILVD